MSNINETNEIAELIERGKRLSRLALFATDERGKAAEYLWLDLYDAALAFNAAAAKVEERELDKRSVKAA